MRKINYVILDEASLQLIKEQLNKINSPSLVDFKNGLDDLQYNSLMLELGESKNNDQNILQAGSLVVDIKKRSVTRDHKEIMLTPKEFDILYFLMTNKGEVFTKEQIYNSVWQDDFYMSDNNIMAFIRKLRKKIEVNPDQPEYIITIWGIGYKFNDRL